ncbi:MAG: flavin monoamine oxidase family protein [Thermodesulfobacteriota bacterium]
MDVETARLDIAVVGGGVTGLYACRKLREALPDAGLALFESSGRLGGRIETVEMDGFLAEYGPMRFEKAAQPLLMELIGQLGLDTCPFHPYLPDTGPEALFDLAADEGRGPAPPLNALEILTLGILRVLGQSGGDMNDPRDPAHWRWWSALGEDDYRRLRREGALDGEPLRDTGFWNALSKVLSHRALNHVIWFGTFYHVVHYNPNAAEWIIFWLRGLHPGDQLVGIRQGTESLVRELAATLSSPAPRAVPLHLGHRLEAMRAEAGGRVRLDFRRADGSDCRVSARRVVLALPWSPLKYLRRFLPDRIARLTDAVIPIPLVKCFFVTRDPWWDGNTPPQTRAASVPVRELHYYHRQAGDGPRGMAMVYGERPSMDYWKHMVRREPHLKAELDGDPRLMAYYLKYLSRNPGSTCPLEGNPEINALTCFGIRDWSREPFEAGCHIWKPGYDVVRAIEELTGFGLPGAEEDGNVHICGEAYSDFQGFIEGGLRNALKVVEKAARGKDRIDSSPFRR